MHAWVRACMGACMHGCMHGCLRVVCMQASMHAWLHARDGDADDDGDVSTCGGAARSKRDPAEIAFDSCATRRGAARSNQARCTRDTSEVHARFDRNTQTRSSVITSTVITSIIIVCVCVCMYVCVCVCVCVCAGEVPHRDSSRHPTDIEALVTYTCMYSSHTYTHMYVHAYSLTPRIEALVWLLG